MLHEDEEAVVATEFLLLLVLIACVSMVIAGVFKRTTKLKMREGNDAVRNDSQFGLVGGWE
jgi:Na+-translocating ferredoxin:NAD+ oxidoreductase RnfG subunit